MELLVLFGLLAISYFIGNFAGKTEMKMTICGRLRVDHSEEDEAARLFLELKGVDVDTIAKEKYAVFEVVNENYLSHE